MRGPNSPRVPRRLSRAVLALLACCVLAVPAAWAADAAPEKEGWFSRELKRFKSYPHLDMAYRKLEQNKPAEAVAEFQKYLAMSPADADAREGLAQVLADQGRPEEALTVLEDGLKLSPDNPRLRLTRAYVLARMNRPAPAGEDFRAVMASAKDERTVSQARRGLAALLISQSRWQDALDLLKQEPADAQVQAWRGQALNGLGRHDLAEEAFAKASGDALTGPARVVVLTTWAQSRAARGNLAGARDLLEQARQLAGDAPEILLALADNAARRGDNATAVSLARLAATKNPKDRESLANVLSLAGEQREAGDIYAALFDAAKSPADRARLGQKLGYALFAQGRYEDAARVYEQAVAADPSPSAPNSAALEGWAVTMERLGKPEQAAALLERAYGGKADAPALMRMAGLKAKAGQPAQAAALLERALAGHLTPQARQEALLTLGEAYSQAGQPAQAVEAWEKAQVQTPRDAALAARLAVALRGLGKSRPALAQARTAYEVDPSLDNALALSTLLAETGSPEEGARVLRLAQERAPRGAELDLLLRQANLEAAAGRNAEAARLLLRARELDPSAGASLLIRAGVASLAAGQKDQGVDALRKALTTPGLSAQDRATINYQLGMALQGTERLPEAAGYLEAAVAAQDLPASSRLEALLALASVRQRQGQYDTAMALYNRALAMGAAGPRVRLAMGYALFATKQYAKALEHFQVALTQSPPPELWVAVARCYDGLGKPGLAKDALKRVDPARLADTQDRRDWYILMGYLHATTGFYAEAADAFTQGLALRPDPAASVRLGRMKRLLGANEAGRDILLGVDSARLTDADKILRLDELAWCQQGLNQPGKALESLDQALAVAAAATPGFAPAVQADLWSHQAKVLQSQGDTKQAVEAYDKALAIRESAQDLADKGYCLAWIKKQDQAAQAWERAVALEPERLPLWEDLGYAYMHEAENDKAKDRFKQAIDNRPLHQPQDEAQTRELEKNQYRLRKEVTKLDTDFTLTAYLNYFSRNGVKPTGAAADASVFQPSVSGVEAAWTPPVIGLRDDRIFQIYGRMNWGMKTDSLEFDTDSTQGAVGVRYKPLKTQNIWAAFERLIKIGENAEDNWLARLSGSWADGWDLKTDETWWNYSFLYGEAAWFLDTPSRWLFTAEARQGVTWKARPNLLITPHLAADARIWSPDQTFASYYEGGGGISFKYLFNETRYTTPRSYVEVLAHYKVGQMYNRPADQLIHGVYVTTIFKY